MLTIISGNQALAFIFLKNLPSIMQNLWYSVRLHERRTYFSESSSSLIQVLTSERLLDKMGAVTPFHSLSLTGRGSPVRLRDCDAAMHWDVRWWRSVTEEVAMKRQTSRGCWKTSVPPRPCCGKRCCCAHSWACRMFETVLFVLTSYFASR